VVLHVGAAYAHENPEVEVSDVWHQDRVNGVIRV
jgi:hypothetical protein